MIQDNILDLTDTNEEIQGYYQNADYDITWHKSLYDAENVAAFDLNANYRWQPICLPPENYVPKLGRI